jgi:hypothetical protein
VLDRPALQGWRTTDEDEIALRRWRGRTEIFSIEALESKQAFFGTFRVQSGSGGFYDVEIRDLESLSNSCGCIDHRANGLGTCKHIEGVLTALQQRSPSAFREARAQGSARIEVFLNRCGIAKPALSRPRGSRRANVANRWLAAFVGENDALPGDASTIQALISAWHVAPAAIRRRIRISRHFLPWIERLHRERSREAARAAFVAEVERGEASYDVLRLPLLPYQRQGMLHLAFSERALLADEMGLGKTVQAIAACGAASPMSSRNCRAVQSRRFSCPWLRSRRHVMTTISARPHTSWQLPNGARCSRKSLSVCSSVSPACA